MSIILVSYIILSTALFAFFSSNWTRQKKETLTESVLQNAEYGSELLNRCKTQEDFDNAMLLICNNIGVTANAIDADMIFVGMDGKVILCKENFTYGYNGGEECMLHKGFIIPEDIMKSVAEDPYFSSGKIEGLFREKTFLAGAPVEVNGAVIGAVFASEPFQYGHNAYLRDILRMYFSSALFAAALSFLVVYMMTAKLTDPLRQMSNATKSYAKGDFSKRVTVHGSDELAELCQSFNRMASALSTLESSRRSFIANVSHELKTPMTTIGGFIDGMLDGTIPEEKHPEYLAIVSDEIKRLSRLVISMLNLSKIEAGELDLKYSDLDIGPIIINCMLSFEQRIDRKNISVEGLENMENIRVWADPDMIHQVVYNLVDNAVKFTDENGTISVFAGENDKGGVYISIQNTGDGVSSEEIGRIFERFYKIDKSRSYDAKSAGLGLYLCKTIVEMHGGKIYADSVEGQFTRFTFILKKPKQDGSRK